MCDVRSGLFSYRVSASSGTRATCPPLSAFGPAVVTVSAGS